MIATCDHILDDTEPSKPILALDPGPEQTAWVTYDPDGKRPITSGFDSNLVVRNLLSIVPGGIVVCEMVACYGMAVGADVFETVRAIGRFEECAFRVGAPFRTVYRRDVKHYLCNSAKAKDANIRQALIDKLGPQGTKKAPGPTYGIKSHIWAALAVAVTFAETRIQP